MIEQKLKELRKLMLEISHCGHDGNLPSCFSCLEIIWTLYSCYIYPEKQIDAGIDKNQFVLSKGQANLALLVVLADKHYISLSELWDFNKFDSRVAMQADRTKFDNIIEISAGSLGHGFPMAVGMAWAKKIKKEQGKIFCLVGDGEMNEGTMWEAIIFAASEQLDNLVLIIDNNNSITNMINLRDFSTKLCAFGFYTKEVNGHKMADLHKALEEHVDKPYAIIANTTRGWGCPTLMEDKSWFHRYPNKKELKMLCREVDDFDEKSNAGMCL